MTDPQDKSLISVRTALLLLCTAITGIGASLLTLASGQDLASSVLTGGGAGGAALALFNQIISNK
jgi:small-conductance mechanosensitive channel